jgi:outer membrane protein insertion porin family/translocation and assembly module TamA
VSGILHRARRGALRRGWKTLAGVVLASLGLALLALAPAGAQANDATRRPEVREVEIVGATKADAKAIEQSIVTQKSECKGVVYQILFCPFLKNPTFFNRHYLDRQELPRDVLRIRAYYWQRGFREARVDTAITRVNDDAVKVQFRVAEGPPTTVQAVRVAGADAVLDSAERERLVVLEVGEPLSLPMIDSSIVRLRDALWQRGYSDAQLDTAVAVNNERRVGAVLFRVDPRWQARVGSIAIEGLVEVDSTTVRNSISLRPGQIFRVAAVTRSQRRLYESSLFRRATIEAVGDSVKDLTITVTEADLHVARLRGGFNTVDFLQLEGSFTNYNWMGKARRLDVQATAGNLLARQLDGAGIFRSLSDRVPLGEDEDVFFQPNYTASVRATQPWFRSPDNTLSGALFAQRRAEPGVVIDRGYGAEVTFTHEVARRFPVSLGYRYELTTVEAGQIYFCVNHGVCDQPTIQELTGTKSLSPLSLVATINRSNDPVNPTSGWVGQASLEHASKYTGSDYRYNRFTVDAAAYRPMGPLVLALHARAGAAHAFADTKQALAGDESLTGDRILHPRKRLYAGGSRSVRGYYENQLGPRILTIDPEKLTDRGCEEPFDACGIINASDPIPVTDTTVAPLGDREFDVRPVGGSAVAEGSVELRFPIAGALSGVAFVDAALLTSGDDRIFDASFAGASPGFGIRYASPVGSIRVDLGINPAFFRRDFSESLPVYTEAVIDGVRQLVPVKASPGDPDPVERVYAPGRTGSAWERFTNNMVLHFSIGQAF